MIRASRVLPSTPPLFHSQIEHSLAAFENPHSQRHCNPLILLVKNCGNERSASICLLNCEIPTIHSFPFP